MEMVDGTHTVRQSECVRVLVGREGNVLEFNMGEWKITSKCRLLHIYSA